MQLQLLQRTTCLTVYYDRWNEWLFLDWEGELTLPLIQEAFAALGTCFLHQTYPRVLNSNEQVTGVHWNVTAWLITTILPRFTLVGIEYVAWIHSNSLRGQHMVQTVLNWLASPRLNAFAHTVDAVTWLQQVKPPQQDVDPPRSVASQVELVQEVKTLLLHLETKRRKLQRV
jgi:hypothetical protein